MAGVYLIAVFVLNELRRVGCFVVFLGVFFFSPSSGRVSQNSKAEDQRHKL